MIMIIIIIPSISHYEKLLSDSRGRHGSQKTIIIKKDVLKNS